MLDAESKYLKFPLTVPIEKHIYKMNCDINMDPALRSLYFQLNVF